jgi:hypothetical protein
MQNRDWDRDKDYDRRYGVNELLREYQRDVRDISQGSQSLQQKIISKFAEVFLWSWSVSPFLTIGMFVVAPLTAVAVRNPAETEYNVTEVRRCIEGRPCIFTQVIDCGKDKSLCSVQAIEAAEHRRQTIFAKYLKSQK